MSEYLAVQTVEIVVGVIVALILVGGIAAYVAYRLWAKKHGKGTCCGNCANCEGCHVNNFDIKLKPKAGEHSQGGHSGGDASDSEKESDESSEDGNS